MRIGIVTDEISLDIREAFSLGVSWGIHDFEFRSSTSGRVPNVSSEDVRVLLQMKKEFSATIAALSPGTFRCLVDDKEAIEKELNQVLPETIKLAHKLDTSLVITFGFLKSVGLEESDFEQVVEALQRAAELAKREGITLALENEPGFWADSGKKMARILTAVNSTHLMASWSPANALGAENYPFPVGYEAVKRWIVNIHVKDATKGSTLACVPVGEGKVNWEGQLRALVKEEKLSCLTIETGCPPLVENSKKNVETVTRMLKKIEKEPAQELRVSRA
jgi:sugar phosphate isomerase/epimerase